MLELNRDQILTIAVVVSIVGISSLYLFSSQQTTRRVSISEIDDTMIGSQIVTEGFVSDVGWFSWTVIVELKEPDRPEGLTVAFDRELADELGEDKKEIRPGAKLSVEGKLEEYEGDLNLRVESINGLSIEEKAYSSFTDITFLLENPRWYESMGVKIRGDVIEEQTCSSSNHTVLIVSSFEAPSYELTCEVKNWDPEADLIGSPVALEGYWEYDEHKGQWKLVSYESPRVNDFG